MKAKLVIIIGCLGIGMSTYAFASGCNSRCETRSGCEVTYCTEAESPCACTDPGWRWNNCMTKERYCQAFGNIGKM
ncbi:hypothetical protein [Aquicella lusitana]|uniref:Uncharacterized protein n=1 Tax=Aquicella lusitana TaxID=254246 RepID=A0A370GPZ3_9COXI|nr:hypothetical protein [Aquicella lusitana]RDI44554.1 hypothetical protein C8D86_10936 [Aquicella lusitana]VVC72504.1 hypothetical protein AQULUS_02160 [Aquicella lusitana]